MEVGDIIRILLVLMLLVTGIFVYANGDRSFQAAVSAFACWMLVDFYTLSSVPIMGACAFVAGLAFLSLSVYNIGCMLSFLSFFVVKLSVLVGLGFLPCEVGQGFAFNFHAFFTGIQFIMMATIIWGVYNAVPTANAE